jgi:hypothetical protein
MPLDATPERFIAAVRHYLTGADGTPAEAIAGFARLLTERDPLTREDVLLDLDVAERLVAHEFAYWAIASRDWDRCLADLRASAAATDRRSHVARLHALFATLGDAHTRIDRADRDMRAPGHLPVQLKWAGAALLALDAAGMAPFDPDHPVVIRLGGRTVAEWVRATAPVVPRGTAAGRRNWTAREIRRAGAHAQAAGAVIDGERRIEMLLASPDGRSERRHLLGLLTTDPPAARPAVASRRLEDGHGVLALRRRMESGPDVVARLHAEMRGLGDARGLVIDIRGNPGGSRDLLRALFGYFLAPGEAVVTSWARLRREAGADPADAADVLGARFMRPWDWAGWSPAAAAAARAFSAAYAPEWPPMENPGFGPLNLLILERLPEHGDLRFAGPVALLINERNYSASDIFASAFARLPQVRLFGTPTSGGSGFARASVLPGSRLGIQISAMASGTVDGNLYENHGVMPDVVVQDSPDPAQDDPVLSAALSYLHDAAGRAPAANPASKE